MLKPFVVTIIIFEAMTFQRPQGGNESGNRNLLISISIFRI